ncbi:MAG: hypothetical protein AB1489_36755, partial [Acidobacteriota bacterium]
GESIKEEREIELKKFSAHEPGEYTIIVRYRSPISQELAPDNLKIWSRENGLLQAKKLSLIVSR